MEGIFPRHDALRIFVKTRSSQKRETQHEINYICASIESKLLLGQIQRKNSGCDEKVIECIKCCGKNIKFLDFSETFVALLTRLLINNISMLKRSRSMELDNSDRYKSPNLHPSVEGSPTQEGMSVKEDEDSVPQSSKKICNSFNYEETPAESEEIIESNRNSSQGRSETHCRYPQTNESVHVTQSKSIFSHKDSFVYGNPKDEIKGIENPTGSEVTSEASSFFEPNSSNALDLSCKGGKDEKKRDEGNTYQNYQRGTSGNETTAAPLRSNVDVKLLGQGNQKKPSLPEQLQIAKIQQQQRRSMQQQQKFLQQMRKSLEPKSSPSSSSSSSNRQETPQTGNKSVKHHGNNGTNHDSNETENHQRSKEDLYPRFPGTHFPHMGYPGYFDPNHPKELPDNHPILPLLDPVYFSALYNAHGFLPPSSPSIAAAFIGTLQDALPKLPMMFPTTSSNASPLLPQKSNENPN
ncbi:hypothetical protein RUM44_000623 [Polyplax serrata]|uniref:Uncharacterized protein n=1 Tax=Polyplax serrata TaxID=468196 RepID=A0ABR1B6Y1_POLSC